MMIAIKSICTFCLFLSLCLAGLSMSAAQEGSDSARAVEPVIANGVGYRLFEQASEEGSRGPLVLYFGGSEGGFPTLEADVPAAFWSAGYSVAIFGYFGFEGGPDTLIEIDLNAVMHQVAQLQDAYGADAGCTGIVGVSKGAELALLLAAYSDLVDYIVANVPSSVVWQSSNVSLQSKSSWTLDGEAMRYLSYPLFSRAALDILLGVNDFRRLHDAAYNNRRARERARIPVEVIDETVFLMSARQDHVWPSYEMSQAIMADLEARGISHNFIHKAYDQNHYLFEHAEIIAEAISFFDIQWDEDATCR